MCSRNGWFGSKMQEHKPTAQPDHKYFDHLEEIVRIFGEWRHESEGNPTEFVPQSKYMDLMWLCIATIGLGKTYLKPRDEVDLDNEDEVTALAQDRHGSDQCEHRFNNLKANNATNKYAADRANGKADAMNGAAAAFNMKPKGNSASALIRTEDIVATLHVVKKK